MPTPRHRPLALLYLNLTRPSFLCNLKVKIRKYNEFQRHIQLSYQVKIANVHKITSSAHEPGPEVPMCADQGVLPRSRMAYLEAMGPSILLTLFSSFVPLLIGSIHSWDIRPPKHEFQGLLFGKTMDLGISSRRNFCVMRHVIRNFL